MRLDPPPDRTLVGVVDDDPSVRQALTRLLNAANLEVRAFASANELLRSDWPVQPLCLVIDFHLPDMNGLVLLCRIGEMRLQVPVPVVIISGETDPALRAQALQLGAAAFLSKPLDDGELLNAIHCALGRC